MASQGKPPAPAYRKIVMSLHEAIAEGRLPPGAKLESERELAARHKVSLMTARRAVVELDRLGLVVRRVGSGTYVAPVTGGARRLRDPHEEFAASTCVPLSTESPWIREWRDSAGLVVTERIVLTAGGSPGAQPLLEILGSRAVCATEQIWAGGNVLHISQEIYTGDRALAAEREMEVHGRRLRGWIVR